MPFWIQRSPRALAPDGTSGTGQNAEWGPRTAPQPGENPLVVLGPIRNGMRLIPDSFAATPDAVPFDQNFEYVKGAGNETLGVFRVLNQVRANVSLTLFVTRRTGPGQKRVTIGVRRVDVVPEQVFFDSGPVNSDTITFSRNNLNIPPGDYAITVEDGAELVRVQDGWRAEFVER